MLAFICSGLLLRGGGIGETGGVAAATPPVGEVGFITADTFLLVVLNDCFLLFLGEEPAGINGNSSLPLAFIAAEASMSSTLLAFSRR